LKGGKRIKHCGKNKVVGEVEALNSMGTNLKNKIKK
jgi:hypothetical protein